ncbi:hypothetical protein ABIA94_005380 [Bradyrhizobium sp. LA7.1]
MPSGLRRCVLAGRAGNARLPCRAHPYQSCQFDELIIHNSTLHPNNCGIELVVLRQINLVSESEEHLTLTKALLEASDPARRCRRPRHGVRLRRSVSYSVRGDLDDQSGRIGSRAREDRARVSTTPVLIMVIIYTWLVIVVDLRPSRCIGKT